ncbi:MAG: hypothetical protein JWP15_3772, partial [Alphaproteobacteria bacterium]|nr:hypothetical protein [Alphaproteobacteria bacterium]
MKKRLACFVAAASSLLVSATHARTGFDLLIRGGEIYSGDA